MYSYTIYIRFKTPDGGFDEDYEAHSFYNDAEAAKYLDLLLSDEDIIVAYIVD